MGCWCLFQEAAAQPTGHPLKGVPIAVAEEDGSESEEDELKPRGLLNLLSKYVELAHFSYQFTLQILQCGIILHCFV